MHEHRNETGDEDMTAADEPASAPLSRRARKALATRAALMEAGLAALEHRPLDAVSVLEITEAADVAKGVFYLHFRSRDEFLLTLLSEAQSRFIAELRAAVVGLASSRERLEAAARHYGSFAGSARRAVVVRFRLGSFMPDEIGPPGELANLRQSFHGAIACAIEGLPAGETASPAMVRTAAILDTRCWGLVSQSLELGNPPPSAEALIAAALPGEPDARAEERMRSVRGKGVAIPRAGEPG